MICWRPTTAQIGGSVDVTIRATDQRRLSTDQIFSITVAADTQAPIIQVDPQGTVFEQGQTGIFQLPAAASVAAVVSTADGGPPAITLNTIGSTLDILSPTADRVATCLTDVAENTSE